MSLRISPVVVLMMRMFRSWMSRRTGVFLCRVPMPMWWMRPGWRRVMLPVVWTVSLRRRQVGRGYHRLPIERKAEA